MIRPPVNRRRRRLLPWLALACALVACGPRPWPVYAHAAINGRAYILAAADRMLARAMDPMPPVEAVRRFTPAVRALRVLRNRFVAAETAVDAAERIGDAPSKCRAYRALGEAGAAADELAAVFTAAGVSIPAEVPELSADLGAAAARIADACADGGAL